MIFVSVGTQLPFDRLVRCMDAWAKDHPEEEVFGQIGPARYLPQHFKAVEFLPPKEVEHCFERASLIVAHAGMGTILSSLVLRKPLVVMPRRQALGEHRSDHQMTTARWLEDELHLTTAYDTDVLTSLLNRRAELRPGREIGEWAHHNLIDTVHEFVIEQRSRPSAFGGLIDWAGGMKKLLRDRPVQVKREG